MHGSRQARASRSRAGAPEAGTETSTTTTAATTVSGRSRSRSSEAGSLPSGVAVATACLVVSAATLGAWAGEDGVVPAVDGVDADEEPSRPIDRRPGIEVSGYERPERATRTVAGIVRLVRF